MANPLTAFFAFMARRRAAKTAATEAHRREVIMRQISDRRQQHREWKPLSGDLMRSTHNQLRAEITLSGRLGRA